MKSWNNFLSFYFFLQWTKLYCKQMIRTSHFHLTLIFYRIFDVLSNLTLIFLPIQCRIKLHSKSATYNSIHFKSVRFWYTLRPILNIVFFQKLFFLIQNLDIHFVFIERTNEINCSLFKIKTIKYWNLLSSRPQIIQYEKNIIRSLFVDFQQCRSFCTGWQRLPLWSTQSVSSLFLPFSRQWVP